MALPPGAIGSAVTGRKASMAREVCKARFVECANVLTAQSGCLALCARFLDDGEMQQDAPSEPEALI